MLSAFHGNRKFAMLVHDVTGGNLREPMVANRLPMISRRKAFPLISRVAFHNRTAQLLHQRPDQRGLQEVMPARLSGGNLDGDLAF
ncbi:hypothetical protein SDC9_90520 [bioreactor metagenome]|uniref:Uncharacterized protein n=1 Tax=bioreactor metagenome TaxID=1076179 RepID=A0A644ZZ01_9ZZZZ